MGLFSRVPAGAKVVKPRLYATIDRATSEYLSAPNLAQNADVIATINSTVDPTYASNKACKRICQRLRTRNQRVQYVSLQLLENCVRSCGEPFHAELARSDLLTEIGRMADRSVWCATDIQRLVLALIQEWAYELRYPRFSELFNRLKRLNLPFEPRGGPMEARLQPYPGYSPPAPHAAVAGSPRAQQNGGVAGAGHGRGRRHGAGSPPGGSGNLGPDLLRPNRSPTELLSDLEVSRGNIALLNEVLDGIEVEGSWEHVKDEYCGEVAGACGALSQRLAGLLGAGVSDERVVALALEVNDDVQRALDRRSILMEVAEGRRAPPPRRAAAAAATTAAAAEVGATIEGEDANGQESAAPAASASSTAGGDAAASTASASAPAAAATEKKEPAPLIDLLSLDWEPTPVPSPLVAPPPLAAPPANNPFAAAAPAPVTVTPVATTVAVPVAAPSAAAAAPNPFLSDDAFASVQSLPISQTSTEQPQDTITSGSIQSLPTSASMPVAAPSPRPTTSSGNPFAAPTTVAPVAPALSTELSFQRFAPPPVAIPTGGAGDFPPTGPLTAPAMYHSSGLAASASMPLPAAPMTSTGAAFQGQQQPSFDFDFGTAVGGGSAAPKKGTDAFSELVSLTPKREELPPPPKGSPMRRGQANSNSNGSLPTSSNDDNNYAAVWASAPAAVPATKAPVTVGSVDSVAAMSAQQPSSPAQNGGGGGNSAAALSAFDAFDTLASGR